MPRAAPAVRRCPYSRSARPARWSKRAGRKRSWQGLKHKIAPMLDPRAQHLLKTLIERYIADGVPVGSRVLSRQSGLELSPASIRNVMADLEEMGFIASPHTSAGRIPTPRGYRFFVDTLLTIKPLDHVEIHQLEGQLQTENRQ